MSRSKQRIHRSNKIGDFERLRDVIIKKRDFYRVQEKGARNPRDKAVFIAVERALTGCIDEALSNKPSSKPRFENLFKKESRHDPERSQSGSG